jgi:hypothetical protein
MDMIDILKAAVCDLCFESWDMSVDLIDILKAVTSPVDNT